MQDRQRTRGSARWVRIILVCGVSLALSNAAVRLAPAAGPPPPTGPGDVLPPPRPAPATPESVGTLKPQPPADCAGAPMPIDLPTALQLANASNPTIALARERVREAYYHIREAQAAFLPNLYGGPQYNRHDGEIQNAVGLVFPTSKWNFSIGGAAAIQWDTPTILFGPLIARRLADAQQAAARSVDYDVQLQVVYAYLDLLRGYGQLAINADTLSRAEEMLNFAIAGEKPGLSKPQDISRARSEVALRRTERIDLIGQIAAVSARLAQLLLLEPTVDLAPAELAVLPIVLVPLDVPLEDLLRIGLANRPELAESTALVGAAQARLRQAQLTPLIPQIGVGYAGDRFGGGINGQPELFNSRGDGTAMMTWQLNGMGVEDWARAKVRRTQMNEATIHVREIQARVAAEVTTAAKVAREHKNALANAQEAVRQAEEMWVRLEKGVFNILNNKYDPLEPLTAEQALDAARTQYLMEVIEFNRSQFQLYWAMGQPPQCALPQAAAIPVQVPAVPGPRTVPQPPPALRKAEGGEK